MHRILRTIVATAAAAAVAVAALGDAGAAQAVQTGLTPWNNAMILGFTVGPDHRPYSVRIIGVGAHTLTRQEIYGRAGSMARTSSIELAVGRKQWTLGRPAWTGVVFTARAGAQVTEFVGQRLQDRDHYPTAAALRQRIAALLATDRARVEHEVGGDWSKLGRQGRARSEAIEVAGAIADDVAEDLGAFARLSSREDVATPVDPRTLDIADRATLRRWEAEHGVRGASKRTSWESELPRASKGRLHAGAQGVTEAVRYHRSVVVSGTAAAWTMTLTDLDDDYAVTWTSGARRPTITG